MSKFIEVQIARSKITSLFLEVPDDFENKQIFKDVKYTNQLVKFSKDLDDYEWEDIDDEIEIDKIKNITEEEAKQYNINKLIVDEEIKENEEPLFR